MQSRDVDSILLETAESSNDFRRWKEKRCRFHTETILFYQSLHSRAQNMEDEDSEICNSHLMWNLNDMALHTSCEAVEQCGLTEAE